MTVPASATVAPIVGVPYERTLCAVIALTALIQVAEGLADLIIVSDVLKAPDLSAQGLARLAPEALRVLTGLAALGFAIVRRLRFGVMALAFCALMGWAADVPVMMRYVAKFGPETDSADIGISYFTLFGQPLVLMAALTAACLNRGLAAATITMAAMTVIGVASFALFALAVALYGF